MAKKDETKKDEPQPQTTTVTQSTATQQTVYATKADTDALLDAVKELTKVVGEISQAWEKWRIAGKF